MTNQEIYLLIISASFASILLLTVWLVRRALPEKRVFWFFGCALMMMFLLGIVVGFIAIVTSLVVLTFVKKEGDAPSTDVLTGFLGILSSGVGLVIYGLYGFLGLGGLYWLWMAIQMKSFFMFVVGIIPPLMLVTAPVGAYSMVFEVPNWVVNLFG